MIRGISYESYVKLIPQWGSNFKFVGMPSSQYGKELSIKQLTFKAPELLATDLFTVG